jgi:hypothetical protein
VSDFILDGLRCRTSSFDAIYMVHLVDGLDDILVALGYHFVGEGPPGAAGEFGYYDVTIAKEVDVEVDVVDGLDTGLVGVGFKKRQVLTSRDM